MIKHNEPLCMAETREYAENSGETESEIIKFIKKFNKLNIKEAMGLKKEIESLNLIKIKREQVVKIIDLLPESAEELNTLFTEINLDEEETGKIFDAIKKVK